MNFILKRHFSTSLPSFLNYRLHPSLIQALNANNFHTPTPIQDMTLSAMHNNNNLLLIAPTGTGKTLAYALSMLHLLKSQEDEFQGRLTQPKRIRGLILVPSKELVNQVAQMYKQLTHHARIKVFPLNGQWKREKQALIEEGIDIAVSTVDRFKKHQSAHNVYLSNIQHLIIDEIDTQLDSCQELEQLIQTKHKTYLVGATLTGRVKQFTKDVFDDNIATLKEKQSHMHLENIKHEFIQLHQLDKTEPTLKLCKELMKKGSVIIFCNSIKSCRFLDYFLKQSGLPVVSLHGEIPKNVRAENVKVFREDQAKIMISTDLGSRGLDFAQVRCIINFDFPTTTSDYLHRVGRCGRAGEQGWAYSLYREKDRIVLEELQQKEIPIKGSSYAKINKEILKREQKQRV